MSPFLYKTGDECIDITGGFISCPYTLTGTSVEVIKNSDNMQLNPNGSGRHTTLSHNTAIDLAKYKSIYFDIEVVSTLGANQWARLGLSTNNNQNDYGVGEVTIENTVGRKLYYIDLTDKTGLAFVKAHINSGTGAVSPFMNIKIYNIWLEENLEKLPTSSSLVNTVEYVKNVNDEIYYLKNKLENNLIGKGVECSDNCTMSSLINKINDIAIGKKWASGLIVEETLTADANRTITKSITTNLSFTPSLVFVPMKYVGFKQYDTTDTVWNCFLSNLNQLSDENTLTQGYISLSDITNNNFTIAIKGGSYFTRVTISGNWYAFE